MNIGLLVETRSAIEAAYPAEIDMRYPWKCIGRFILRAAALPTC